MPKLKIYPASVLSHAHLWIDLASKWQEFTFCASWPITIASGIDDTNAEESLIKAHWELNLDEIFNCDVLLHYADPHDNPRGALIETGACLALGKRVMLVGSNPAFGTWQYHPLVYRASKLSFARQLLAYIGRGR